MTPYVTRHISSEEVALFEKIRTAVQRMADLDLGMDDNARPIILSCHMMARAVARAYSLRCVDGFINPNFEHSWVLSPEGHIIDVYPVAVLGGPILIENKMRVSPAVYQYRKASRKTYRGRFGKTAFRRAVNRIAKELEQAAQA